MERLTERLPSGVADYAVNMWELMPHEKSAYRQKCVEALAAYGERGYTPDEIDGLALEIATLKTIETMYDKLGPVEDLTALVKAREEGQMFVSPVALEQKIYKLSPLKFGVLEWTVARITKSKPGFDFEIISSSGITHRFSDEDIGKTVFLTRAEAEAALSGGGGDV